LGDGPDPRRGIRRWTPLDADRPRHRDQRIDRAARHRRRFLARSCVTCAGLSVRNRLLSRMRPSGARYSAHDACGAQLLYVAVKGGERAIEASWRLLDPARRGDPPLPDLDVAQIRAQMRLAVARVMTEGSVYDEELAALAIKQAAGDLVEAIFLLRAYRTTLPRFGYTRPIDTERMEVQRRISATFKDVPGGQMLGATYDYTQRLLDFALPAEGDGAVRVAPGASNQVAA